MTKETLKKKFKLFVDYLNLQGPEFENNPSNDDVFKDNEVLEIKQEEHTDEYKDALIEELMQENEKLYKKGVLLAIISITLILFANYYRFKSGEQSAMEKQSIIHAKVYNLLQSKISKNVSEPLAKILNDFNYLQYFLNEFIDDIDMNEFISTIEPQIDNYLSMYNFNEDNFYLEENLVEPSPTKTKVYINEK